MILGIHQTAISSAVQLLLLCLQKTVLCSTPRSLIDISDRVITCIPLLNLVTALQLSDLPEDVLVLILQQVDQQDRLRACARVSTRFKAAAQAASCCVQMQPQQTQVEGALSWLRTHGSTVTSLDFTSPPGASMALSFLHLPCSRLQDLKMTNAQVKLSAPASSAQHTCR